MTSHIVTIVHRPKRAPRKRKAAALPGPAIVTKATRRKPADTPPVEEPEPTPPPANDDAPAEPAPPAARSGIVTATSRKRAKLPRPDLPDDPEADAAMRAWLERAKWGHGPAR